MDVSVIAMVVGVILDMMDPSLLIEEPSNGVVSAVGIGKGTKCRCIASIIVWRGEQTFDIAIQSQITGAGGDFDAFEGLVDVLAVVILG